MDEVLQLPFTIVQDHDTTLVKPLFRVSHEREPKAVSRCCIITSTSIGSGGKVVRIVNIKFNQTNRVQVTSVTGTGSTYGHGGHVQTVKHSCTVFVGTFTRGIQGQES